MTFFRKITCICAAASLAAVCGCGNSVNCTETSAAVQPQDMLAVSAAQTTDTIAAENIFTAVATTDVNAVHASIPPKDPEGSKGEGSIDLSIICDEGEITTSCDYITLRVTATGDVSETTGAKYSLEKLSDGEWKEFPFSEDRFWIGLAYEISAYSSPTFAISLRSEDYAEPVAAGIYRVVKDIGGELYYAQFTVEDA